MKESSTFELENSAATTRTLQELPTGSSSATILGMLDLLAQERRRLLRFTAVGLVLSLAVAFLIPRRYEAVTQLMPPDQSSSMGAAMLGALTAKAGDNLGAIATDMLGMHTTGATLVGILTSRTIQDDLINKFDLRSVYWTKRYDVARKALARRSDISEDRKSGIITIRVQDSNPERAAALARAYVDELNARVSHLTTSSAHRERVFLEQRLQSIKRDLDQSSLQLSQFSSQNRTFDPTIQGKAMLEAASTLQGQLIAAETELSGLQQIYGPDHPRIRAASARVSELRTKLHNMSGSTSADTAQTPQLGSKELYPSLEQLPLLSNTYYALARQAKIDEAVYEALTKQFELAKVEEAKEIPSIKVLDEPVVPEHKSWPPRTVITVVGTLLFALAGIGWIYLEVLVEGLDPHDPRRMLLMRLFGPLLRRSSVFAQLGRRPQFSSVKTTLHS